MYVISLQPWGHVRLMYIGIACMVVLVLYILLASLMDTHGGAAFTKALVSENDDIVPQGFVIFNS